MYDLANFDYPILNNRYQIKQKIGSGAFGTVYMAEDIETLKKVAIKQVSKFRIEESDYLIQAFWKELQVMKICNCENSVCLYDFFEFNNYYNIIMELCDTDLEVILKRRQRGFTEEEIKIILTQMNVVFNKMNKTSVIHRDLKLKNILVKYDKSVPLIGFVCKLADFGFSKTMVDEDITRTKLGTPATMAPEILMNKSYNQKADLWSWGIIIYQLLFNKLPFIAKNERDIIKVLKNTKYFDVPSEHQNIISNGLRNLIQLLLQVNPGSRMDYNQYFSHPYFNDGEIKEIGFDIEDKAIEGKINNNNSGKDEHILYDERFFNKKIIYDNCDDMYIIYKAKDKSNGKYVYLKEILKKTIDDNPLYKGIFFKEIELLKTLKGNCFIEYIDLFTTSTHYIIVTEHFEGKILDNFIQSRGPLSESLTCKIIQCLIPSFKEINDRNIILEFISPKSFCFKSFISEDNFSIKFFDYGISAIFTPEISRRNYYLSECKLGSIPSKKTNILSMGLIIYKMINNREMYLFNERESTKETIDNQKEIKYNKNISLKCINFIEKTCTLQMEKRYDWILMINDPFIKPSYDNNIKYNNKELTSFDYVKIDDHIFENIAEFTRDKIQCITNYYDKLILNERKNDFELYNKFYKEMSICSMLTMLEIKLFLELLKPKDNFYEDEEIHLMKIYLDSSTINNSNNYNVKYDYSYVNFFNEKIIVNRENQILDKIKKEFYILEIKLKNIISTLLKKIDINIEDMDSFDYMNISAKSYFTGNLEKYFFKLFENGVFSYSKNDYSLAFEEFTIAQYCCEYIILIRIINSYKKETIFFKTMIDNIFKEDINTIKNNEHLLIMSFIGGAIKTFKEQKVLEETESCDSDNSNNIEKSNKQSIKAYESLINFYPDVIKMIKESQIKLKEKNYNK